ncbi:MAG: GGDEF domain-containing protein [Gammaproteobacteria bacterium]|nr:GGDEF domain-containing protein [Gammaproteobacteria bacterium]
MTQKTTRLLESAIHITKGRDKRSLANSLMEVLIDYMAFDSAQLLTVPPTEAVDYLEVTASITARESLSRRYERSDLKVEYDELISKCIKSRKIISKTIDDSTRTIFPVAVSKEVTNLLIIHHHHQERPNKKIILGFLNIYGNFIAVLSDNERDTLTGLLNRKTFDSLVFELLESIESNNKMATNKSERRHPTTDNCHWLAILDIDHFKHINDNFGHLFGDEVLMMFANLMNNTFRSNDLLFRYGGEEFVVIIQDTTEKNTNMVFERFRKTLEEFKFPQLSQVTVSIGIAKFMPGIHPSAVIEQADQALYYSKNNGRNQISNYLELVKYGKVKSREITTGDIELF